MITSQYIGRWQGSKSELDLESGTQEVAAYL